MTEEQVQIAILQTLTDCLPDELQKQSEEPMRFIHRLDEGRMVWREELVRLPPLAELWAEQHLTLNYPAIILHYRDTQATSVADCDEHDFTYLFQLDLIVTHNEPEQLQNVWLRYAEAVKAAVKTVVHSIDLPLLLEIPGQRITESGPSNESEYLRRGLIDLQITF